MATAYLVRLTTDHDLVGFFVADSVDALWIAVDECTDVEACEYAVLPDGGIYWGAPAVPVPIDGRTDRPIPWNRCELSERWWTFVYGDESVWLPLASMNVPMMLPPANDP